MIDETEFNISIPREQHLKHHGVLGMKWGVRKSQPSTVKTNTIKTKGIRIGSDGSMSISKGAQMQRLVRSKGENFSLKDQTYASLTEFDNAKYVNYIGGKGFFGGGRDRVLTLTATKTIKAPSVDDATKITSDLFLNDKKFRETFTDVFGRRITEKELKNVRNDPKGKTAKEWYTNVNQALTFSPDFSPSSPYVQKTVRETFQKKGYNALRDENDFQSGLSKSPIIIFSPETTLKVTKMSDITDELRSASKETLKEYSKLGKNWTEKYLYD